MKKITLIVSRRHLNKSLKALRGLGLLHIKHVNEPRAEQLESIEHKLLTLDKALVILENSAVQKNNLDDKELSLKLKEVVDVDKLRRRLSQGLSELAKKTAWFKQWGNVSSHQIAELEEKGVFIKLYSCDKASLKHIPKDKTIQIVSQQSRTVLLALVSTSADDCLDFSQVEVPGEDQQSLTNKIALAERQFEDIDLKLSECAVYKNEFVKYKVRLLNDLEFHKVQFGSGLKEELSYLRGFCPAASIEKIAKISNKEGWAIIVEEPDKPEEVPTLIKNPAWIEIIKPIFKFMETVPGYKEYDISFWFLLFFSIFFAMLIGDAGYGVIFLLAAFFVQKKLSHLSSGPFFLLYVLSGTTIIWGAVSGNWFGFEKIGQLPFFNGLIISGANGFVDANKMTLMHMCFVVGAVHLSIAHAWIALRHSNSLFGLAHVGWIAVVWSIYYLVSMLVLENPYPSFASYLLIGGLTLVVLFSNPQRNIIKGICLGIADLPLKLVSSFADTLSYLRLFAIGYASLMIAASFNELALTIGFSNPIRVLGAALILLGGHALNITLGFMSVLVHGIRLNMLEFSGHLNMEWAGVAYEPFKE